MIHHTAKGKHRLKNKSICLWPGWLRVVPLFCWTEKSRRMYLLALHHCTKCPRQKAMYRIFLLPLHGGSKTLQTHPRWDIQSVGTLEVADPKMTEVSRMLLIIFNYVSIKLQHGREALRKSSKSSNSNSIIPMAFAPWLFCTQQFCFAGFVNGYILCYFSIRILVCLYFCWGDFSKYLFLKSLKNVQAICIGVHMWIDWECCHSTIEETLHHHILPRFPKYPVHNIRKCTTSTFHKRGILCLSLTIVILKTTALRHSPEGYLSNRLHKITN